MKLGQFADLTPTWGVVRLTENKTFEYQFESKRFTSDPFEFSLSWTTRKDHAGFEFVFSIYRLFWICFSVYDNRHWDYERGCWAVPETCTQGETNWHTPDEPRS